MRTGAAWIGSASIGSAWIGSASIGAAWIVAAAFALSSCTAAPGLPEPSSSPPPTPMAAATSPARAANAKLRTQLLAMLAADQRARTGNGQGGVGDDQERTARLAAIVERYGWPTRTLVGVDGATAAWAIAQHSDLDVDFQRRVLELMTVAAADGEADRGELAYLTDRVAANSGQPQTYGTQRGCTEDGRPAPAELVDPDRVDERRAAVGLPPIAEYLAEMTEVCAGDR